MKTALIIGATGLTGKQLTYLLLGDKRYAKVVLLVRTPLDTVHQKLEQVVYDFDNPGEQMIKADDVYCCLGTTIRKAGSKAAFYKVDYEYVLQIAHAAYKNGAKNFALVSSMGANKKSSFFYQRTKGEIEEAISRIGFEGCYIFRPSILKGHRNEFRPGEAFMLLLVQLLGIFIPKKYKPIAAGKVAKAMADTVHLNQKGIQIYESHQIAALSLH
ncbi:MAG TPA: oxidoreductase [Ferruginibacter sp.]|nr:oxidoreductase [Ferruginibacter sp.]HMP20101.1 oxidoreductase [Ferruginibacter sp.]